jgi:hypothetical protein
MQRIDCTWDLGLLMAWKLGEELTNECLDLLFKTHVAYSLFNFYFGRHMMFQQNGL